MWMATDFREERRWRIAMAYTLARDAVKWLEQKDHRESEMKVDAGEAESPELPEVVMDESNHEGESPFRGADVPDAEKNFEQHYSASVRRNGSSEAVNPVRSDDVAELAGGASTLPNVDEDSEKPLSTATGESVAAPLSPATEVGASDLFYLSDTENTSSAPYLPPTYAPFLDDSVYVHFYESSKLIPITHLMDTHFKSTAAPSEEDYPPLPNHQRYLAATAPITASEYMACFMNWSECLLNASV
jgi:hypothetical protein